MNAVTDISPSVATGTRSHEFVTVDVFTGQRFGGNPLAVVLDADGIGDDEMQALAAEFNYSETTFVLPPADPAHTARVRIFNRRNEMPFAGHPNVGTALVLASRRPEATFTFEEPAGLVTVSLERDAHGRATHASVQAPQPLSVLMDLPPDAVAECLGLARGDIDDAAHAPVVASVGVTFGLVPVRGDALERARPNVAAFEALARRLPALNLRLSLFLYRRADGEHVDARMFAPLDGTYEDPATGSATAALVAYLLSRTSQPILQLRVSQGVKMGRPSLIVARAWRDGGIRASIGGGCVEVFRGRLAL